MKNNKTITPMEELKCCPFCGGKAQYMESTRVQSKFILCTECAICFQTALLCPKDELILAWNTRK